MAAYAAAVSLKTTIEHIRHSSRVSLVHPSFEVLQPAYHAMVRLQEVLLKLDETVYSKIRTKVNDLDERIKEVVCEFEDIVESHFTDQILRQLESSRDGSDHLSFSVDLRTLQQSVDYFVERVTLMEVEYDIEVLNMPEEEGEPIYSRIDSSGINSEMVGLSDEFEEIRDFVLAEAEGEDEFVANWLLVTGMAGVGKTTLVKKVFEDPSVQRHFELRAWIKVGRKCESNEIFRCILAQVEPNTEGQGDDDNEKLVGLLEERMKDKKCLIVLDDVWYWDPRVMDNLPQVNIRILLTSRLRIKASPAIKVRLLNDEESKKSFCEKIFGQKDFPRHLEEMGEKIVKKCEGLPLMIVKVAELLSKEDMTLFFWTEVAEKQYNSVFVDAYNQISEVFYPSYDYLPQYLKMFFLYMGNFPSNNNIQVLHFFTQLSAEGFLESSGEQTLNEYMFECLVKLDYWCNLVLYESNPGSWFSKEDTRVHSCWQNLCKKEANKIKFLHVLESFDDVIKDQRRLCAHFSTLFTFKQVYDTIRTDCASTVRSLLCYSPDNQYPVPIHVMDFKLLRVLEASDVRFYHIPLEIMKLVCLKYLALTYNKELPISISNLLLLQSLTINEYMTITKRGDLSYMPVEIWDMQELQNLAVVRKDLPIPKKSDAALNKLSWLSGVSAKSCTKEILKRIPNLKMLQILMELKPYDEDDDSNSLSDLGYISEELKNLIQLTYHVINPDMKYELMVPLSMFSTSLTTMALNGLGCPWNHLNDIGSQLPNLVVLGLADYAFRGPMWDIEPECFVKLETLKIEDTDLVWWKPKKGSLPRLELLSIRHCYKLQQFDWMRDPSMATTTIELIDCNPLALASGMHLSESLFTVLYEFSFIGEKSLVAFLSTAPATMTQTVNPAPHEEEAGEPEQNEEEEREAGPEVQQESSQLLI